MPRAVPPFPKGKDGLFLAPISLCISRHGPARTNADVEGGLFRRAKGTVFLATSSVPVSPAMAIKGVTFCTTAKIFEGRKAVGSKNETVIRRATAARIGTPVPFITFAPSLFLVRNGVFTTFFILSLLTTFSSQTSLLTAARPSRTGTSSAIDVSNLPRLITATTKRLYGII